MKIKYKILYQNTDVTKNIREISNSHLYYDQVRNLRRESNNIFSFNQNFTYFLKETKVGELKQKMWNLPQKIFLKVEEGNLEFLNYIIIHILAIKTGSTSD